MALSVKNRRFVYLGIIVMCLLILALSISGLFRFTTYAKRDKNPMLKEIIDEDSKKEQRLSQGTAEQDVSQEIYGLYLPTYDKEGNEIAIIRGAHTAFLKNNIYKIAKPEVEITTDNMNKKGKEDKESKEGKHQPKVIVVTSDFGEMNKTTNRGLLYGNVITRLGDKLKIYTDDLKYSPDDKVVNTDGHVTVQGDQMRITGDGFEVKLSDKIATIKNDPEMEITSNRDQIFLFSDKGVITNRNIEENIFIRSNGELVFENEGESATFHENVRISKGNSTIFADKLFIPFDSKNESLKTIVATGNILASDGKKNAKGETLTWDSEKEIGILEDDPVAEFFDEKITLTGAKIIFSKVHGRIEVPVSGQLTTIVNSSSAKKNKKKDKEKKADSIFLSSDNGKTNEKITVNWKGKMTFEQSKSQAIFEDDVVVSKGKSTLSCGRLLITFNAENDKLEEMEATKDVHLVEEKEGSSREAYGDKFTWTSTRNYIELFGSPVASVDDGEKYIAAPKISFAEEDKKVFAEGKGNLSVKSQFGKESETPEPIEISWDKEMIYNGSGKIANFYEMVKVTKGTQKLDCDRLDIFFDDEDEINKATAFGNVYLASPDIDNTEGLGTLLEWDMVKGLAVLTGNPLAELRRSGARTFSEKIFFDMKTQRVHWKGRPHWKIYETQK
jgi:LPS export ABC transporter protein LptC/lipopolysaccharide transport protein LptA